jgi:hypothetical protein
VPAPTFITSGSGVVREGEGIDELLLSMHPTRRENFVMANHVSFNHDGADILGELEHGLHYSFGMGWPVLRILMRWMPFKKSFAIVAMVTRSSI